LKDEITPIKIKDKKAEEIFEEDEEWKRYKEDKISSLAPAFSKTGTITAANSSKINDGACSIGIFFVMFSFDVRRKGQANRCQAIGQNCQLC
jgi:acetyl-CoA acetyltransferase